MSRTPTPEDPHADRTAADRGRPDEYPPNPPSEAPGDYTTEVDEDLDNAGKVTSPPLDKPF
jgi:hypothetical protein